MAVLGCLAAAGYGSAVQDCTQHSPDTLLGTLLAGPVLSGYYAWRQVRDGAAVCLHAIASSSWSRGHRLRRHNSPRFATCNTSWRLVLLGLCASTTTAFGHKAAARGLLPLALGPVYNHYHKYTTCNTHTSHTLQGHSLHSRSQLSGSPLCYIHSRKSGHRSAGS